MRGRLPPRALIAAAIATSALALAGVFPLHNNDAFGHLAQGRQIAELGYVPSADTFSFWRETPQTWHNYEWGSDLLFWSIFSLGGAPGLLAFKAFALGLMAMLLLRRAADSERLAELSVIVTAGLLLWSIPGARFRFTMRPELFGYVLSALYLVGLGRLVGGKLGPRARLGWVAGLILAHLAWVNLHGSHLLGVCLALAHLAPVLKEGGPRRDLFLVLGGFVVASCISPYGPAIVMDAIEHVFDPVYREVVREWAPWSSDDPVFYLVALVVQSMLLVIAAIPLFRTGSFHRSGLATAALLGIVGFRSIRFVATFLLLSSPLIAPGLARILRVSLRRRATTAALGTVLLGGAVAFAVVRDVPPKYGVGGGIDDGQLPVVAAQLLEGELRGARVLAPVQTSWYLMYASPSSRFLVDGRVPFYGPAHLRDVSTALAQPDQLEPLLIRHRVDALVLDFASSETQGALLGLSRIDGYYPISIEDDHVLFAAYLPGREALIESRAFQALPTRLDPVPLLAPAAPVEAMRAEIARLDQTGHADAIRSWYAGVLALRELSRGRDAGFAAPRNDDQRASAVRADAELERAAAHYPTVPVVHAYRALAAVAVCDSETVRSAAARAGVEGESREALLATVEVALRTGDEAPARELLAAAAGDPRAEGDPWLAALSRDLEAGVRCR